MRANRTTRRGSPLGRNYVALFTASTISNLGDGIGIIAYPWLASAVTRDPFLIALVAVVQRLPWLVFSLPAGVITDRTNRRTLMVGANAARAALTLVVAVGVLLRTDSLPGPELLDDAAITTDAVLYVLILTATLFLGIGEVLYDNAAQTLMPSIVDADQLEKANGRMWSAELVANTFIGPPLGALLLVGAFAVPFFVDAATFAIGAVLIALIPRSTTPPRPRDDATTSWRADLREGFGWLWRHDLLRTMAIVLGLMNMLDMMATSSFVLFGQEVLDTSATEFALLGTGGAIGGIVGGWTASRISRRFGSGTSLLFTFAAGAVTSIVIGLSSRWPVAWVMFAVMVLAGTLWNVITVSLRQTIIPDHLLGRVNSVYRFFAWGMLPIGAALGGLIVVVVASFASREWALRAPWIASGVGHVLLLAYAAPRLTTARLEAARTERNRPVAVDGESEQPVQSP
jgi:MFS family permease